MNKLTTPPFERIILASASPYRAKLLRDAGIRFESFDPQIIEANYQGSTPAQTALMRSEAKLRSLAFRIPQSLVIGCDQTLSLASQLYHKVWSPEEAFAVLTELQGHTHYLHTAFSLGIRNIHSPEVSIVASQVIDAPMTMKNLDKKTLENYINTGEWKGSVGCYKIEGQGKHLFTKIYSETDVIIGLPLDRIRKYIRED